MHSDGFDPFGDHAEPVAASDWETPEWWAEMRARYRTALETIAQAHGPHWELRKIAKAALADRA